MRTYIVTAAVMALGLTACGHKEPPRDQSRKDRAVNATGREAGRAAYQLSLKSKAAAKEAAHDMKEASQSAWEGWNEARREHERQQNKR